MREVIQETQICPWVTLSCLTLQPNTGAVRILTVTTCVVMVVSEWIK